MKTNDTTNTAPPSGAPREAHQQAECDFKTTIEGSAVHFKIKEELMENIDEFNKSLNFADSYQRITVLLDYCFLVDQETWLTALGEAWESCDNIGQYIDQLMETPLFFSQAPILCMMTPEEIDCFNQLPDEFFVYRGCYEVNKWGLSWSMDRKVAEKFPTFLRYKQNGQPLLVKAAVKKTNVMAVKLGRDEAEIITYRPKHVSTSKIRIKS